MAEELTEAQNSRMPPQLSTVDQVCSRLLQVEPSIEKAKRVIDKIYGLKQGNNTAPQIDLSNSVDAVDMQA